ncbi:MAG: YgiT-type zinc finger protein [Coleofasciculus sp. D1-CHI-01]|uniref:YgiT-type zinc finger protein n=1 Tax=Coleofasciculus sp. D1-CHI-01 TaxID=3068482 RepID=UPI0032F64A53
MPIRLLSEADLATDDWECDICGSDNVIIRQITRAYGKGEDLLVIENIPILSCPDFSITFSPPSSPSSPSPPSPHLPISPSSHLPISPSPHLPISPSSPSPHLPIFPLEKVQLLLRWDIDI